MSQEEPSLSLDILRDFVWLLETHSNHWRHPMLLPMVFCSLHLARINTYCSRSLTNNVMQLEDELSVTRVGHRNSVENLQDYKTNERHRPEDDPMIPKGLLAKDEAMRLTIRINTQSTRLLVARVSPAWTRTTIAALIESLQDISIYPPSHSSNAIRERFKSNVHLATYLENYLDSLHARLTLQLNVLYSFIAQSDNQYSARLAELSGRDSTSMKILAFITTIFLPGTFVATMFSMDLFSWKHDSGPGASTLSSQFWVYWFVHCTYPHLCPLLTYPVGLSLYHLPW